MTLPTERPPMAGNAATRFFGGPPLMVILRLVLLCILVGVVLRVLGLDPFNIWRSVEDLITPLLLKSKSKRIQIVIYEDP